MKSTKLICITTLIVALAPLAVGDAVTDWNANAGVAATAACIAPLTHSTNRVSTR